MPSLLPTLMHHPCVMAIHARPFRAKPSPRYHVAFASPKTMAIVMGAGQTKQANRKTHVFKGHCYGCFTESANWWSHAELCGMSILFQPSKVLYSRSQNIPDGILLNRIFWWTMQVWESWGSAQKYAVLCPFPPAAEVNLGACSLHPKSTSRVKRATLPLAA